MLKRIKHINELDGDKRDTNVVRRVSLHFLPAEIRAISKVLDALDGTGIDFKHLLRCIVVSWLYNNGWILDVPTDTDAQDISVPLAIEERCSQTPS